MTVTQACFEQEILCVADNVSDPSSTPNSVLLTEEGALQKQHLTFDYKKNTAVAEYLLTKVHRMIGYKDYPHVKTVCRGAGRSFP